MTAEDLVVFERHTGRTSPPQSFKETYLIIGRRGGKSFISALVTCFIACLLRSVRIPLPSFAAWIIL